MTDLNEITVFSVGDSKQLKTWSNVPYFFTKTLEEKGVKVNRVNIEENAFLNSIYKFSIYAVLKLIYKNSNHTYFRSGLNYFLTCRKINKAQQLQKGSQASVFLTFSFGGCSDNSKTILFGDWTYMYYLQNFLNRKPYWFEKKAIEREKKNIQTANFVLSLFPQSAQFIKNNFQNKLVQYLGNVINANFPLNKGKIVEQKLKSKKIIFIGNKKYFLGALALAEAFKEINILNPQTELHFIGLNEIETNLKLKGIFYHGYLDKGNEIENKKYYELIYEARVIVNTNEGWGAFSAVTEAMYYFTPVITSPYNEFTETYGTKINFGYYVANNSKTELVTTIEKILNNTPEEQIELMKNAHETVKDFTWNNFTDKFINFIS